MLLAIMIATWAMLIVAKGTPAGAAMHRWLVERPAAKLSSVNRQTWLMMLALTVIFLTCWGVIGKEGIIIYSMVLPEMTLTLAMIDLGIVIDVALVLVAAASSGGWRGVVALVSVWLGRARATRARRTRRPERPAANDDEEGPLFALAA